jgi:hypothetical protein
MTAGAALGFVVLNPASGPGSAPDVGYQAAIDRLGRRSTAVVGYVDTGYGERLVADVLADVSRWESWYGVTNIFFDQAASGKRDLSLYRRYVHAVHDNGGRALLNPGRYPDRAYLELADVTVTFEGTPDAYRRQRRPSWAKHIDPARVWNLIYSTPAAELASTLRLTRTRGAGFVYITDDALPDPWNALATYWSDEDARVVKATSGCPKPTSWPK